MASRISMSQCKTRLTTLWFLGSGILFALVFAQTIGGRYGEHINEAWSWLLPNILPTLSLMAGVLIADSSVKGRAKYANRFLFQMAFCLSVMYLLTIILTILSWPLTDELSILSFLRKSSVWLAPIQGLISGLIGVFFVQKEDAPNS